MSAAGVQYLRLPVLQLSSAVTSSRPGIAGRAPLLHLRNELRKKTVSVDGLSASRQRSYGALGRHELRLCRAGDVSAPGTVPEDGNPVHAEEVSQQSLLAKWRMSAVELRAKAAKWGLAAALAYGLFDGITYTTFFVLAFLGYEKSTGQNPATNLKALLGVVVLMWGGNNVTRPFRVAGAAALAPLIDRGLKRMQEALKLPNQAFAFMICVAVFASLCFSVIGILILSRLGR
ncbi:hypothetical protein R1sor_018608 [Riccia sorocarpa]|uniref:Uncharacterized protein n=1 Tax=Riccia sorocarpa TaxID=122646 RepID=A0ABD3IEA1_9MARC